MISFAVSHEYIYPGTSNEKNTKINLDLENPGGGLICIGKSCLPKLFAYSCVLANITTDIFLTPTFVRGETGDAEYTNESLFLI